MRLRSHNDDMELRETLEYQAPPERVYAMLVDRGFRERVCAEQGALHWEVSVASEGAGTRVEVVRVLPARVPDLVKRMVGETIETVQTERWGPSASDGARRASLFVQVRGQPATVTGELGLEPVGAGTQQHVVADVRVKIPFVGGRIEPEIASAIRAGIAVEHRLATAHLAG